MASYLLWLGILNILDARFWFILLQGNLQDDGINLPSGKQT